MHRPRLSRTLHFDAVGVDGDEVLGSGAAAPSANDRRRLALANLADNRFDLWFPPLRKQTGLSLQGVFDLMGQPTPLLGWPRAQVA
jgi:hypothetical protein